jgi:hypothetical protein
MNHLKEDLAKFGYRSVREEIKKSLGILLYFGYMQEYIVKIWPNFLNNSS